MSKIIIDNRSNISDFTAIEYVLQVMGMGKISNKGKQHCYLTAFDKDIHIVTDLNKKSERFVIYNQAAKKG